MALVVPGGPAFVDALERAWANGDAVLPLDPSAPRQHLDSLIASLAPTKVVESDGEARSLEGRPVEDGDAIVVASSGTTGRPKGAVHTHAGVRHAAFSTSNGARVGPDSRWLACLPLSHVGGLSVVTRALLTGTSLEVHPGFDAGRVDDARRRGATHVSLVPTTLSRIDPDGWTTILLGGSAIPADRPASSIATYGMTETFGGVVYDGLALGGTSLRITGEDGEEVPPGTSGTVELRTPSLLRCYRDGTDPVSPQGWYRTGDLGSIDPVTHRLQVHGRADDLIVTGGENVWPAPVEALLATHEAVREVAVVGEPDPDWGQRVVALVVPDGEPPSLASLRELVKERLPVAAAPKELRLVDSLPRTALGKIRRSGLALDTAEERGDG